MKELSMEEKAERYDDAIEIAEKWHNAPNVDKIPTFAKGLLRKSSPNSKRARMRG